MTRKVKTTVLLSWLLLLLLSPTWAQAQGQPRLVLSAETLTLKTGEQTTVEILVQDAAPVYGVETYLSFDPAMLEVVETSHGNFLSADPDNEAFVIQNEFNNEQGRVAYAVALLNPAPPVEGDGLLMRITFRAKTEGQTVINLEDSLFGTQTGEEIVPTLEIPQLNLTIEPGIVSPSQDNQLTNQPQPVPHSDSTSVIDPEAGDNSALLGISLVLGGVVIILIGVIGVIGLIGVWFFFSRRQRSRKMRRAAY